RRHRGPRTSGRRRRLVGGAKAEARPGAMSDADISGEEDTGVFGVPGLGDVVAGKYRVFHVLGVGGMGVVVSAQHIHLAQPVAIKFLLPAASSEPEPIARFLREARAVASLKSDHIVRVVDVDTLTSGAPYMVMEHLVGTDLGKL